MPFIDVEIRKHYSCFNLKRRSEIMSEFECLSIETNEKCVYNVFNFLIEEKNPNRITEISEILLEVYHLNNRKRHFQKYLDYLIKTSKNNVRIEIVRELNVTRLDQLSSFGLAIFFYNLRAHLRDLITSLSFLKSRFIGDPRWLRLKNIGFSLNDNQIQLLDFVFIGLNYKSKRLAQRPDLLSEEKLNSLKDIGRPD